MSDTPASRALAALRPGWWLAWLAAIVGIMVLILTLPPGPRAVAQHAECDKQVAVLLTSHDPIDLQRAMFIIRRLNCSITDRLPKLQ